MCKPQPYLPKSISVLFPTLAQGMVAVQFVLSYKIVHYVLMVHLGVRLLAGSPDVPARQMSGGDGPGVRVQLVLPQWRRNAYGHGRRCRFSGWAGRSPCTSQRSSSPAGWGSRPSGGPGRHNRISITQPFTGGIGDVKSGVALVANISYCCSSSTASGVRWRRGPAPGGWP